MKLLLYSAIFLSIALANRHAQPQDYQHLLQGEWSVFNAEEQPLHERFCISFESGTCSDFYPWGSYLHYSIQNDKLNMWSSSGNSKISYSCTILALNDSLLTLVPLKTTNKLPDTLRFFRLKKLNNITPGKIAFASSQCFGTCPSLIQYIDNSRNVTFFGLAYTQKTKGYNGILSKEDYNVLLRQIHSLPIETLKKNYTANWTDDQTCGISISWDGKTIQSSAYGFNEEPIALRLLLHKLMEVYEKTNLRKDTSITISKLAAIPEVRSLLANIIPGYSAD